MRSVVGSLLSGDDLVFCLQHGGLQRVPRQARALDAHRVFRHAAEDRQLAERLRIVALAGDQTVERSEQRTIEGLGKKLNEKNARAAGKR